MQVLVNLKKELQTSTMFSESHDCKTIDFKKWHKISQSITNFLQRRNLLKPNGNCGVKSFGNLHRALLVLHLQALGPARISNAVVLI